MSYRTLKIDRDGAVEILTLNRPEALNALSPEMIGEIGAYFTGLAIAARRARRPPARGRADISAPAPISAPSLSPKAAPGARSGRWRCRSSIPAR